MHDVRLNVSSTIFFLLSFISLAAADPVCDLIYGQPEHSDCRDLLINLYSGWPGQAPDREIHYFSVYDEVPPSWIKPHAIRRRKYLPQLAAQGTCRAALTAIRLQNDTITSDSAYWHDIWTNGLSTLNGCVDSSQGQGMGGYHHTGSLNRLIFTIFATGSTYDDQIQAIVNHGDYVCSKEAVPEDIEAKGPEISSESIDCGQVPWIKAENRTLCSSCSAFLLPNSKP
ncbi:hypothetical protein BDR22DRAFT_827708 [Usnea florida]